MIPRITNAQGCNRRRRENIASLQRLENPVVRERAKQSYARREAELVDLFLEIFAQRSVPNDLADEIEASSAELRANVNKLLKSFERDEPADTDDARL